MLIVWVSIVHSDPKNGATLVISSATIIFMVVVIWHVGLLVAVFLLAAKGFRLIALVYGLANSIVSFLLWGYCIGIKVQYFIRPGLG